MTASDWCRSEQEIIVPTDAVHNAKVQLTATLINNVAAAFIVLGSLPRSLTASSLRPISFGL
jgi:hypothetical protein